MSSISSPIEAIARLQINALETQKAYIFTRYVALNKQGSRFVALTDKGEVVSSAVREHVSYSYGSQMWDVLEGLAGLGVVSRSDVKKHKRLEQAHCRRNNCIRQLAVLETGMRKAGIAMTKQERKRLTKLAEEGKLDLG